ncbi:MAG: carbohydrate kinase family protein [candidate division Zixibacteria bacterium]|nr:carbohydrate kinase family protein [candidate division Zixibacteria bacterium]
MTDVVCLGRAVIDVMAKPIENMPIKGEGCLVEFLEIHPGGSAVNTAIALAKLGINPAIIGVVGKDFFGDFLIKALIKEGVDIQFLRRTTKSNTSSSFVMISQDGERSFFHYIGANSMVTPSIVDFSLLDGVKMLHVAPINLMPSFKGEEAVGIMAKAKKSGLITSIDTTHNLDEIEFIRSCLKYTDIFLPNYNEAKKISGKESLREISENLLAIGTRLVVIKMGDRGCYLRNKKVEMFVPGYQVNAVDTTGAGDAFVAGFLLGTLKGWELNKTAKFANAVGAMCVQSIGSTSGIGNENLALDFMRKAKVIALKKFSIPLK